MRVSIIIPTLCRESLYPLVDSLLKQKVKFHFEIILIPQYELDLSRLKDKRIKIRYEEPSKGFAFYRNKGIKLSRGSILVFIDDDELPMNNEWLRTIVAPIADKKEKVVTAGVDIPLGQGYLADSISLLGFPGGGALGFTFHWSVNDGYTTHLCSGNLAIEKRLILRISNFSEKMKYGSEDVDLAKRLVEAGIKIKYLKEVTVLHSARGEYLEFLKWNILRGKSAGVSLKQPILGLIKRSFTSVRAMKKVAKENPRYLPGMLFTALSKHVAQIFGLIMVYLGGAYENQ